MTVARHTLDIYGVDLHLATTEREWKNLRRRLSYLDTLPDSAGLTHFAIWEPNDGGRSTPVVAFWIRGGVAGDLLDLVATCAHEATHAASHILTWTGHDIRGDRGGDEPMAYLVGWLTQWLWTNTKEGPT